MRGEIWLVDLNPIRGSEQAGVRSAIVMQRPNLDRFTLNDDHYSIYD